MLRRASHMDTLLLHIVNVHMVSGHMLNGDNNTNIHVTLEWRAAWNCTVSCFKAMHCGTSPMCACMKLEIPGHGSHAHYM